MTVVFEGTRPSLFDNDFGSWRVGRRNQRVGGGKESIYAIENMVFRLFAIDLCLKNLLPWTR
jgi:hypothetical protein